MGCDQEVYFVKYCRTCKYRKLWDYQEPCNECITHPYREDSHKPIKWEGKETDDRNKR